jgi:hypothetical protein
MLSRQVDKGIALALVHSIILPLFGFLFSPLPELLRSDVSDHMVSASEPRRWTSLRLDCANLRVFGTLYCHC